MEGTVEEEGDEQKGALFMHPVFLDRSFWRARTGRRLYLGRFICASQGARLRNFSLRAPLEKDPVSCSYPLLGLQGLLSGGGGK
jgi:hypothetical protein